MVPALALLVHLGPAGLTAPPTAGYCGGPIIPSECASLPFINRIALAGPLDAPIPYDGVLLLEYIGSDADLAVDLIDATVTVDDIPVPGAFEPADLPRSDVQWPDAPKLLVWRPQTPFAPGATHHFSARLSILDEAWQCAIYQSSGYDHDFTTTSESAAPLTPPAPTGLETLHKNPVVDLESLACCPGERPYARGDRCGGYYYDFDPAMCTSVFAYGILAVELTGPAAAHVVYTSDPSPKLSSGGSAHRVGALGFSYDRSEPFCVTVTAHDLARGSSLTGPEQCFGDKFADQLGGPFPIAPPDTFTCELQQCEPADNTWDLDKCAPDTGCGCTTTQPSPASLLLLIALGRRRARR